MRSYSTKELGIPYPYIRRIFLDGCGSPKDSDHYSGDNPERWIAHAHICPDDPLKDSVCFGSKVDFDRDYNRSILWHEYAHILNGSANFICPHNNKEYVENFDAIQKSGHDKTWIDVMIALRQYVPLRYFKELWGINE